MHTANGSRHRRTMAALLSASVVFQFGGCELGEVTTTVTLDSEDLVISIIHDLIIDPLEQALTDAVTNAFDDD